MTNEKLIKLIEANSFDDYRFFIPAGLTTHEELQQYTDALNQSSSEKYISNVRANYESAIVRKMLIRDADDLEVDMQDIQTARTQGKTHIAVELLEPRKKVIKQDIEMQLLYDIIREYIHENACNSFVRGLCVDKCQYDMQWDESGNCYNIIRTSYLLLRKYSGGDNNQALTRLKKLME